MRWHELSLDEGLMVFTTAELRWRPIDADQPNGPQIAALWGDPEEGAFAALVHDHSRDVYRLVRREGICLAAWRIERS